MASLYDELESYLRALETLGVTTEKCASILYPMVESCFQEDFLKAWNRSATSAASTDAKERLTNLMTFLKAETEGEERINLAMAGFGLGVDENRQSYSVTCNLEALDHTSICDKIASITPGSWISELNEKKIQLSDVGEESRSVQVPLGSDVIRKLMTGQRRILSCGLAAMETILGWTLSGKVPDSEISSCNVMLVASLFVKRDGHLPVVEIGFLGDTRSFRTKNQRGASLSFNGALLKNCQGLQVTTHKLKKENLFKEYGDVFKEWKPEGIIKEVPKEELKSVSHYLPHRHVVKPDSTTKFRPVFNASSKQRGTVSLKDCLEKGFNLIELIPSMLARFRLYIFGVSADIRKVFLQISLYQQDRNFLRFL
ncbi:uncharacterized protein TNCV_135941 [Trichonephila clavipes]|nr:uncharacterized protein TNCV_135941 [Trichonephila clavipes]